MHPASRPTHVICRTTFLLAAALLVCGACRRKPAWPAGAGRPGGGQGDASVFVLDESNSVCMAGRDDPENERWCDIAGNFYSTEFCRHFSYEDPAAGYHPVVRVRIEPEGDTFRGRIEARGLKPNFAYQIKLRGDRARDPMTFERIGYHGRWRLGEGTNWTDYQYEALEDKSQAEAYILFDWFVTDARGNAVRDFALCQSYHVLWEGALASSYARFYSPARIHSLDAADPALYSRPKPEPIEQPLCAEVEYVRYRHGKPYIRLPPGRYTAQLVLTEESFHSNEPGDGGYWATILNTPVEFLVISDR